MLSGDKTIFDKNPVITTSQFRDVLRSLIKKEEIKKIFVICPSKFKHIKFWNEKNIFIYPIFALNPLSFFLKSVFYSFKIFRKNKINLIISQDVLLCGFPAAFIKFFFKKRAKLLLELHGDYLDNHYWLSQGTIYKLYNVFGKFLLRYGDLIRATSLKIKQNLLDWGIPENKIFFVPHRTDINKFKPGLNTEQLRLELNINKDDRLILFVGRFAKEKAINNLIESFYYIGKEINSARLILVGSGEQELLVGEWLKKYKLDKKIIHIKNISNSKMPYLYNLAELFLLTSVFEGRPKVIQEALACGVPVIATRLSGVTELVTDGKTGFIVDVNQPELMAEKAVSLLKDRNLLFKMRASCRKRMENDFTWEKGINYMVRMYKQAILPQVSLYNNKYFKKIDQWSSKEKYQKELDEIIELVAPKSSYNVLDVGCCAGNAAMYLQKKTECSITGVDFREGFIKKCKISAICADAHNLPFSDNSFDLVYALHVIGHVYDPTKVLSEIKRVMKPEGKFVLITPNIYFVRAMKPLNFFGIISHNPDKTVLRYYSMESLKKDFLKANLKIERMYRFGNFPYLLKLNIFRERLIAVGIK